MSVIFYCDNYLKSLVFRFVIV